MTNKLLHKSHTAAVLKQPGFREKWGLQSTNLIHSSLKQLRVTSDTAALAAVPFYRETGSRRFQLSVFELMLF